MLLRSLADLARFYAAIRAWRLAGACFDLVGWLLDRDVQRRHMVVAAWLMTNAYRCEVAARVLQGESLRAARWRTVTAVEHTFSQAEIQLRKERGEA